MGAPLQKGTGPVTRKDIDRFFHEVSIKIKRPLKVYLLGGVAAWFQGGVRPTEDIDFGVDRLSSDINEILAETSRALQIPIQFSDDPQRWGMINIPSWTRGAKLYRRYGRLLVYVMAPGRWAIGKLNRYLESDVEDIVAVFKKQKPPLSPTLHLWRRALRESPHSSDQQLFKNQVDHFLKNYGQKIWGKQCPAQLFS